MFEQKFKLSYCSRLIVPNRYIPPSSYCFITHPVVLVRGYGGELSLREDERLKVLRRVLLLLLLRRLRRRRPLLGLPRLVADVQPRLVAVHRVQYHLRAKNKFVLPQKVFFVKKSSHVSVVVQLVVCELELVEGDDLLHPVGAAGGGVGVDVDPACENEGSGKYLQTAAFLSVVLVVVGTYSISTEVQVFFGVCV